MSEFEAIEAKVVKVSEFPDAKVSPGDEVKLYRRLEDMYKPNAVAVLNKKDEPIGYLEESIAEMIIEKMREGIRFRCEVAGERQGDEIPIRIYELGKPEELPVGVEEEEEELEELLELEEEEEVEEEAEEEVGVDIPLVEIDEDIPLPVGRIQEELEELIEGEEE